MSVEGLSYRYAYAQAVLARGDEKLAPVVAEWARLGGRLGQLRRAAKRHGVDLDAYAFKPPELPGWHRLVSLGLPLKALRRGYAAALTGLY